jgi:hypothetical protein
MQITSIPQALILVVGVEIAPATIQSAPYEWPPESENFDFTKARSEPLCPPEVDPAWRERRTIE